MNTPPQYHTAPAPSNDGRMSRTQMAAVIRGKDTVLAGYRERIGRLEYQNCLQSVTIRRLRMALAEARSDRAMLNTSIRKVNQKYDPDPA